MNSTLGVGSNRLREQKSPLLMKDGIVNPTNTDRLTTMSELEKNPFLLTKNRADSKNVIYLPPMTAPDTKRRQRPSPITIKLHNPT